MKELSDDEIQKLVEAGLKDDHFADPDAESIKIYALLFKDLKIKPAEALSPDFAEGVIGKIRYRKSLLETLKFYLLIVVLILIFFAAALATFIFAEVPFGQQVINFMGQNTEELIFAVIAILLVQVSDKLLVRNRLSRMG